MSDNEQCGSYRALRRPYRRSKQIVPALLPLMSANAVTEFAQVASQLLNCILCLPNWYDFSSLLHLPASFSNFSVEGKGAKGATRP